MLQSFWLPPVAASLDQGGQAQAAGQVVEGGRSAPLCLLLRAIVAGGAGADPEASQPEQPPLPLVRIEVVDDSCGRGARRVAPGSGLAEPAERMCVEMLIPRLAPHPVVETLG